MYFVHVLGTKFTTDEMLMKIVQKSYAFVPTLKVLGISRRRFYPNIQIE